MYTKWTQEDEHDGMTQICELDISPQNWFGTLTMTRGQVSRCISLGFLDQQDYELGIQEIEELGGIFDWESCGRKVCWENGIPGSEFGGESDEEF